jgi:hypothetical protein
MGRDAPLTLGTATKLAATTKLAAMIATRVVDPKKPLVTAIPPLALSMHTASTDSSPRQ